MTSTFILAPGEEFIQCPYNTAHQITNARFLTHLDKCRKSYIKDLTVEGRAKYMKICRHNALHHVPAPELRFHEDRCVDAFSVVRHMAYHNSEEGNKHYQERRKQDSTNSEWQEVKSSHSSSRRHSNSSRSQPEPRPPQPLSANSWGLEEENWEEESTGYQPGYDPEKKLKSELVIYNPAGLTKSERKKFRNEVRQKAAEMSFKGEPIELPTASSFDVKPPASSFDVKPNMTGLKIKEEGRSSPREPGEIDDDEDEADNGNGAGLNSGSNRDRHSDNARHGSHEQRPPSSSASSSRHYPDPPKPRPNYSRPGSSYTRRVKDEDSTDSDDFAGYDPYA